MKTVEIDEAKGLQLSYLVASAAGYDPQYDRNGPGGVWFGWTVKLPDRYRHMPNYHKDIQAMWPLMEEHNIMLDLGLDSKIAIIKRAAIVDGEQVMDKFDTFVADGGDWITAAARCFAKSVLGETAEVPDELS